MTPRFRAMRLLRLMQPRTPLATIPLRLTSRLANRSVQTRFCAVVGQDRVKIIVVGRDERLDGLKNLDRARCPRQLRAVADVDHGA